MSTSPNGIDIKSVVPRPPKKSAAGSAPSPIVQKHAFKDLAGESAKPKDKLSRPSDDFEDINFKVSPDFKREFKITAVQWGMSMKDLLEASFKAWKEKIGNESPKDLFEK